MEFYYFASQQSLVIRVILFFLPVRQILFANGWRGKCKHFRGKDYVYSLNRHVPAGTGRDVPERGIPERP
jgi:hypothetical protein